jgi:type IV secretory pathway TraG/TraD family ATPase VirD4
MKQSWPKDHWETFLSNAGLKIFFSIEDHFMRHYISKLAGETESLRELQSTNESLSGSESRAEGKSESQALTQSSPRCVSNRRQRNLSSTRNLVNWQNS